MRFPPIELHGPEGGKHRHDAHSMFVKIGEILVKWFDKYPEFPWRARENIVIANPMHDWEIYNYAFSVIAQEEDRVRVEFNVRLSFATDHPGTGLYKSESNIHVMYNCLMVDKWEKASFNVDEDGKLPVATRAANIGYGLVGHTEVLFAPVLRLIKSIRLKPSKEEMALMGIGVDQEDARKILKKYSAKQTLGSGTFGTAYLLNDNTVLKITRDDTEAWAAKAIEGKRLPNVADVYNVRYLKDSNLYSIHQEYIPGHINDSKFRKYLMDLSVTVRRVTSVKVDAMNLLIDEMTRAPYSEHPEWTRDLVEGLKALRSHQIAWTDCHVGNMGIKNGSVHIFDVGYSQSAKLHIPALERRIR